jgi:hypothetical protein
MWVTQITYLVKKFLIKWSIEEYCRYGNNGVYPIGSVTAIFIS